MQFAFTIKMPTLHRLATLRDDVIFFVYLYQTFKYKVDHKRVNEFGQGGDDQEVEEKLANHPLQAPADGAVVDEKTLSDGATVGDELTARAKPIKATGSAVESGAKRRK